MEQINTIEPKKKGKAGKIIGIILLLIIAAYAGYYLGTNRTGLAFAQENSLGLTALKYKDVQFAAIQSEGFYGLEFTDQTENIFSGFFFMMVATKYLAFS